QRGAKPFERGRKREQRELRQQRQRVGAKTEQVHVTLEAELIALPLERGAAFALAEPGEASRGTRADHDRRGTQQVGVVLVRRERRDRADPRSVGPTP